MKTIEDLYFLAEDIIEQALLNGDEETALIIEEGMEYSQNTLAVDAQLAELLLALLIVEDRVMLPEYSLESVLLLRATLRGVNSGTSSGRLVC